MNLVVFCLLSALCLVPSHTHAQTPNPPLADVKAAAEAGDPQAQDKLADTFRLKGDFEDAVTWYRRSAPAGILNSQYQLAHTLLMWARSPSVPDATQTMHAAEAIPWLQKAASKSHTRARLDLGQLYLDGKFIKKDLPEAYKWFCLAADGSLLNFDATLAKSARDNLILRMTQDQIADGNQLIAAFRANPDQPTATPEPSYFQRLKLQGITATPGRPLAIINGRTLAPGDTTTVKLDGQPVTLRCLSISRTSATISIDGFSTPKELHLR